MCSAHFRGTVALLQARAAQSARQPKHFSAPYELRLKAHNLSKRPFSTNPVSQRAQKITLTSRAWRQIGLQQLKPWRERPRGVQPRRSGLPGEGSTGWTPRMDRGMSSSGPKNKTHGFLGHGESDSSLKIFQVFDDFRPDQNPEKT